MTNLKEKLAAFGLSPERIFEQVKIAINEDISQAGDITSEATISDSQSSAAQFIAKANGTVCGLHVAATVLEICEINDYEILVDEGGAVQNSDALITTKGKSKKLLLAERTALNFLTHLSGIATLTSLWVKAVSGTNCKIRDTRKTTPGLRELDKFAVRMGGGVNHRLTLSESILIKDNHIMAAGGITKAFKLVKEKFPNKGIEIEVDNLEQLSELISLNPNLVLLDNMSVEQCYQAVLLVNKSFKLEASGGLTLANAKAYADTGVDFLAVGALTHSAPALDIGLDFREDK